MATALFTHPQTCLIPPSALRRGKFNCCRITKLTNCLLFVSRLTPFSHHRNTIPNYSKANRWIDFFFFPLPHFISTAPPSPLEKSNTTPPSGPFRIRGQFALQHGKDKQAWRRRSDVKPRSLLQAPRVRAPSRGSVFAPRIPVITHAGGDVPPPRRRDSRQNTP